MKIVQRVKMIRKIIYVFIILLIGFTSYSKGLIDGRIQGENKPFTELVDIIKDNKSVFIISRKDAEYLVNEEG